ncbi:MAG: ABC transporter permease [Anaerolineae bacterium]|nr:ABC transporter permease [Anaerolineae bacterium]
MASIAQERASSQFNPSPAVTVVDSYDGRTLGLELLALTALFLVVVAYHLQNPISLYQIQFGSAFRNATLQPVIVVGLILTSLILVGNWASLRQNPIRLAAAIVLLLYGLYIALAVIFDFNLAGAFLSIDQAVFVERLNDDAPFVLLNQHLQLTAIFEYCALAAVVILWEPWKRLSLYARALRKNTAPILVAIIVVGLWEVLIHIFGIQEFLLPRPSVIGQTFIEVYPRLVSAAWNTFQNAFWGFVFGCGAGILTGIASARFTSFSQALLPLAVGINAVPIIALAPIMNLWFGALNPASKIAIVAVLTYFPAMVSTVRGLNSADQSSQELMKTYAATQITIFRKLRLPSALPFIFSALKVATTLSMIGAIVREYFGGSTAGLGFRIRDDAGLFKYPEAWSAILMASIFGILFYLAVSTVERSLMHWHISFREK